MSKQEKKKNSFLSVNLLFGRISLKDKAIFARNLAIMLKSGLSIIEALDILAEQHGGKFGQAIRRMTKTVAAGNALSQAIRQFPDIFPKFFISAVEAGESSGNLENNLGDAAEQMVKEKELRDKIKGAMFYPLIVLVLSFIMAISLSFLVLPKITPIFTGLKVELPATTRFLIWFSGIIEHYGFILLAVLAGLIIFAVWLFRRQFTKPFFHFLFLHLPIIKKISRYRNLSLFSRTLGTLLKSGLTIDEALAITGNSASNYYFKKSLIKISGQIGQGGKLSEGLAEYSQYFPKLTVSMIKVGEKSGNLEEELFNLAYIYEAEVDNSTKMLATAIEPILLIIIGLVVGLLAMSIITPIYKITGSVYR